MYIYKYGMLAVKNQVKNMPEWTLQFSVLRLIFRLTKCRFCVSQIPLTGGCSLQKN